jgi:hypothetical protein
MLKMFTSCLLLLSLMSAKLAATEIEVNHTLDTFHQAASDANADLYFSLLDADSVFIGTDAKERWSKDQFKKYALPIFAKGQGWTYLPRNRHIQFSVDANTAWFDELLDHKKYGESRGTGVLVKTENGWKIMQYHLTFPIPNEIVDDLLERIILFQQTDKQIDGQAPNKQN